jgi:hypothetical protein
MMIRSIEILSDTIPALQGCAIFRLIPDGIRPATGEGHIDPPTDAAFAIERIVELDAGETFAETGILSRSIRVFVRNRSSAPAVFRMVIPVMPTAFDAHRAELELLKVARDGWARTRARVGLLS